MGVQSLKLGYEESDPDSEHLGNLVVCSSHYLHLTKRFGIIAASQLPLHYLLALKSSLSPISYLTSLSHEELNLYHRALGRIILLFLSLHASFYLNFFIQKSLLTKRIRDPDVILGLLAITTFLALGTSAFAWIRKKNYFLFFLIHVATSILLLPMLYFHVPHLRVYILESALIYVILIAQRNISTQTVPNAEITHLTNNLLSITIPLAPSSSLSTTTNIHPGQHIYLSLPSHSKLRLNPFTIANLHRKDTHIRLIVRTLNGTTRLLSNHASSTPKTPPSSPITTTIPLKIEGPYGSASTFPNLSTYNRILLVAGGVGATFTMPIYRHLISQSQNIDQAIRFIWAVKKVEDAKWGFEYLDEKGMERVELYVSNTSNNDSTLPDTPSKERDDDAEIELQEHARLLSQNTDPSSPPSSSSSQPFPLPPFQTIHPHRPDLKSIINELFSTPDSSFCPPTKIAILVCGPAGMGSAVRKEVGVWVGRGREVWFHCEEFGW
ncbi:MAG: hypothetical protein Q9221_003024 [Calogaya cf. arnoldii]